MSKEKTISNLEEFLKFRGVGQDPAQWARAFYKYTDCGPWVVFLTKGEPSYTRTVTFAIGRNKQGKLILAQEEEDADPNNCLQPTDLINFAIEKDHTIPGSTAKSLKQYRKLVEDYAQERGIDYKKVTILPGHPQTGEASRQYLWIEIQKEYKEKIQEVYYTEVDSHITSEEKVPCDCRFKDIGPDPNNPAEEAYISKEANPACKNCYGRGIVSKSFPTGEKKTVTNQNCVGIKFGSIVEGSEQCSGPFTHMFPFLESTFERDLDYMEKETSFYWERDNSTWYEIQKVNNPKQRYFFHNNGGDIKWDSKKPTNKKLLDAIEKFQEGDQETNSNPRKILIDHNEEYEFQPLPDLPTWEIREIVNDQQF